MGPDLATDLLQAKGRITTIRPRSPEQQLKGSAAQALVHHKLDNTGLHGINQHSSRYKMYCLAGLNYYPSSFQLARNRHRQTVT